jgi:hypothetical protein
VQLFVEEGLMAVVGALTRHEAEYYYTLFVMSMLLVLGGARVRRAGYLTSVCIKPPPSCVICAHKLIVSLISSYMIYHWL